MVKLTVEPPEYYPLVDKFFADGLVEALEALGIDVTDIKAGVKSTNTRIRIGFLIELVRPDAFSVAELETIISALLEKLADEATRSVGKFYNASFEVVGFKIVESRHSKRKGDVKLVVNAPEDVRRNLERVGKGLMIYLKDRGVEFSSLVINVPQDGRPRALISLLLKRPTHPLEKERLASSITEKTHSYLRTLSLEYFDVEVNVSDPNDTKAFFVGKENENAKNIAEGAGDARDEKSIREILEAFGQGFPEL